MKSIVFVTAFLPPAFAWAETPYAGMQSRQIKSLSDRQIADLRAGRGMGFPVELNGYPGPSHVLEVSLEKYAGLRGYSNKTPAQQRHQQIGDKP